MTTGQLSPIARALKLSANPSTKEECLKALKLLRIVAKRDFLAYRIAINGDRLISGWFTNVLAAELQRFYDEWQAGETPTLVIECPPQHGKSTAVIDFLSWIIAKHPEERHIFASFSDRLGTRANRGVRRIFSSPMFQTIFPDIVLPDSKNKRDKTYSLNDSLIELPGHLGYFRNTTVGGAITGESITGLGVIDDPIKGREQANSATYRTKIWDWWNDDWSTRFSVHAAQLIVMTRWHLDDLVGKLTVSGGVENLRKLTYPAVATRDELYRAEGEALFPELKPLSFLLKKKKTMAESSWQALFQQNPTIPGGNIVKSEWIRYVNTVPTPDYIFLHADTAQKTKEQNDYSVFTAWAVSNNVVYLYDMTRGKWTAPELRRKALAFWKKHSTIAAGMRVSMRYFYIEDKSSGSSLIQELKRKEHVRVKAIQRDVDKVLRVQDASVFIESGQVRFVENVPHLDILVDELLAFPNAPFDDTVEGVCDATVIALRSSDGFAF